MLEIIRKHMTAKGKLYADFIGKYYFCCYYHLCISIMYRKIIAYRWLSTHRTPEALLALKNCSIFVTTAQRYTVNNDRNDYQICSIHGARRIQSYLRQNQFGQWQCTAVSSCMTKESAGVDRRNKDQATCATHNQVRFITKLRFNPDTKQWECRSSDPCAQARQQW